MRLLWKLPSLSGGHQTQKPTAENSAEFLAGVLQVRLSGNNKMANVYSMVKVKVQFTLEQATKGQWGSRGAALLFL
jgi:hypothetical protein